MTPRELADLTYAAKAMVSSAQTRRQRWDAYSQLVGLVPEIYEALRSQAEEIARLKDVVRHAEYWEAVRKEERDSQAASAASLRDEIDALKAAAIVQGSIKLDEAVKQAKRREAIKAVWGRITGNRGWLSCVEIHDERCQASHARGYWGPCTCGADAFRRLMEE